MVTDEFILPKVLPRNSLTRSFPYICTASLPATLKEVSKSIAKLTGVTIFC
jgi:hypothetical protein